MWLEEITKFTENYPCSSITIDLRKENYSIISNEIASEFKSVIEIPNNFQNKFKAIKLHTGTISRI